MRYMLLKWFTIIVTIVVIVAMAIMTLGVTAHADSGIDLSAMTEDELIALISDARHELTKFNPFMVQGSVLYEDENITLTYAGHMAIDDTTIYIGAILENRTDSNIIVEIDNIACNGRENEMFTVLMAQAHSTEKVVIDLYGLVNDAKLNSVEDIQDIGCNLIYIDSDTFETIYEHENRLLWLFDETDPNEVEPGIYG